MPTNIYIQLDYDAYKRLEIAMRAMKETTHTTVSGFYHKSVRLPVGEATIEFHGPNVAGDANVAGR